MKTRKVVFWERQNVYEAFEWFYGDWKQVETSLKNDWHPASYEFFSIVADQDQFENRINGMIRI